MSFLNPPSFKNLSDQKLLLLIILAAVASRFYGLDRLSLWSDELWVVMESSKGSLWEVLQQVYYKDNHPPGYYVLMRYSQLLFGSSDWAIRFPSAIAGILLVGFTFIAGKKHLSPEAALLAAALVCGSYQMVYYSQEARPNIFSALFSLIAFHYFRALALEKDTSNKNFAGFWISSALSAYFNYVGLVFYFSLGLIYSLVFLCHLNKQYLLLGIKIFVPVIILYLPWVPGVYYDLMYSPTENWHRIPDATTLLKTFDFLFGSDLLQKILFGFVFIVFPIGFISASCLKKLTLDTNKKWLLGSLWLASIFPVAFFFIKSNIGQPAYNARHFLHAIPLIALLASWFIHAGLVRLAPKYSRTIIVSLVFIIVIYQAVSNICNSLYQANHFKQDYRESVSLLKEDTHFFKESRTAIISNSPYFDHYLSASKLDSRNSDFIYRQENQTEKLQQWIMDNKVQDFYFLEAPKHPAKNRMITDLDGVLARRYTPVCRSRFVRTQIIQFKTTKAQSENIDWEALPPCPL